MCSLTTECVLLLQNVFSYNTHRERCVPGADGIAKLEPHQTLGDLCVWGKGGGRVGGCINARMRAYVHIDRLGLHTYIHTYIHCVCVYR